MTTPKKQTQARLRLVTLAGELIALRTTPRRRMHSKKIVRAQILSFIPKGREQIGPILLRDAASLTPLLDSVDRRADIGRHFRESSPRVEDRIESCHAWHNASDELSGQGPPMIPMTESLTTGTIRPMGRGITPVKFRAEMAKRLSSARVVAGYETKKKAADALGVGLDRYEKWESGRTPVPAQYVVSVCALFHIDANYLFGVNQIQAQAPRRAVSQ